MNKKIKGVKVCSEQAGLETVVPKLFDTMQTFWLSTNPRDAFI
jgi:hypothetical protein